MQRPFVHTGRMQGNGVPRVNWQNPMTAGLLAVYVPAPFFGGPIINLAYPGIGDLNTYGGGLVLASTTESNGLALTGTATNLFVNASTSQALLQPNGFISAFVRGKYTGNAGTNIKAPIFGCSYNGTATLTTPNYTWALFPVTATTASRIGLGIVSNNTPTFTNIQLLTSPPALVTNAMASAGFSMAANRSVTSAPIIYQNGSGNAGTAAHAVGFYGASPLFLMGDPGGGGENSAFTTTVAYFWQRVLSSAEHRYLDINPYSLLLWPSDYEAALLVGTTAPPPVAPPTSQPLLSPLTIGLGGAAAASRVIRRNPLLTRRRLLRPWE